MRNRTRSSCVLLFTAQAILCVPVLLDLLEDWMRTPLRYFAADTFYYLVVARNWADQGIFSFDQVHATNGFHPLWQLMTASIYRSGRLFDFSDHTCLVMTFVLSTALVSLGLGLIGVAIARHRGHLPLLYLGFPVGAYALPLLPFWVVCSTLNLVNPKEGPIPLYGTLWSFMNGMESGLAIASFGGMALCFSRKTTKKLRMSFLLGVMALLLTLSRLDHVFISVAVLFAYGLLVLRQGDRGRVLHVTTCSLVFAIPILAYMWHNLATFGSPVPLSGALKSTFPSPHLEHFRVILDVLRNPFGSNTWLDSFYRVSQILLPCFAVGLFWILALRSMRLSRRDPRSAWSETSDLIIFLLASGAGIAGLAAYNFFFVLPFGLGHWYFPVSVTYVTMCLLVLLPNADLRPRTRSLLAVALALLCLGVFWGLHRRPAYHERFISFYLVEAPRIRAHYGREQPRIIEYDDGIIGYATGFPTLSGLGFTLDKEAYEARATGDFFRLALERGFDRISTLVYANLADRNLDVYDRIPLSREEFVVRHDYASEDGTFGILQFAARPDADDSDFGEARKDEGGEPTKDLR